MRKSISYLYRRSITTKVIMSNTTSPKARELTVSRMASKLIGSEIIKLAAEINEKIKNGETVFNLTIGDFNPKMVAMYMSVGGVHAKTHFTMRYLFDRSIPFERAPMLGKEVRALREVKSATTDNQEIKDTKEG